MNRREAVQSLAFLLGGTLVGANAFLTGCKTETGKHRDFTPEDVAYLDEIADTILPDTKTPGAKAAKVGQFMTVYVNDCYEARDQDAFFDGMKKINDQSKQSYGDTFMKITPQQRHDLLVKLDAEQKKRTAELAAKKKNNTNAAQGNNNSKKDEDAPHYFRLIKETSMLGYFTSEIGCTQARRYVPVPGKYEPCVPYNKGDKAWAL